MSRLGLSAPKLWAQFWQKLLERDDLFPGKLARLIIGFKWQRPTYPTRQPYWKWPHSSMKQSCKSGRLFESGLGLKLTKISSLIRAWDVLFVLGAQKYNQNNLATLLNFSEVTQLSFFLRAWFGLQNSFRVRAYIFGFGPELVGPFTTLVWRLTFT